MSNHNIQKWYKMAKDFCELLASNEILQNVTNEDLWFEALWIKWAEKKMQKV